MSLPRDYVIPTTACEYRFVTASGPGGQHVNKTATAVELRVDVEALALPSDVTRRLYGAQRNRINKQGALVIQADRRRSQLLNRKDADDRLLAMIEQAYIRPKARVATRPSRAAQRRRVDHKKQRGKVKANRRKPKYE